MVTDDREDRKQVLFRGDGSLGHLLTTGRAEVLCLRACASQLGWFSAEGGWESRRHNGAGAAFSTVRLGVKGVGNGHHMMPKNSIA